MVMPWQEGGAFWPWYMSVCVVLLASAAAFGPSRSWEVPALFLAGLLCGRAIIAFLSPVMHEFAFCALWLSIAMTLVSIKAWVPAFCCGLSAWAYVALWPLGYRIGHLGITPILADAAFLLGVAGFGIGLAVFARDNADRVPALVGGGLVHYQSAAKGKS